jgi:CBS domain-containing protein
MIVRNVMHKDVITIHPNLSLREASKIMSKFGIGSLVVMEDEKLVGIITSTDIIKAIAEGKDVDNTLVSEIMSKDVVTVDPDESLEEAVEKMMERNIKRLPVVEGGKLVGIITASDIIVVEPKLIEGIANLLSLKLPGYKGG